MARAQAPEEIPVVDVTAEKKKLKEERKKLKEESRAQKKEAKARAKELSKQESELDDDDSDSGTGSAILVTFFIILIWIAILCLLIKLDVGGFGSNVLRPILKDVPVISWILPTDHETETTDEEAYGGYTSLREAVDQILVLEQQLEQLQTVTGADAEELERLRAEVERLQSFEDNQLDFERIKNEFYQEVVYAANGPGVDAYIKYYESMDPTTAEAIYARVIAEQEQDLKMSEYASAYAAMKPKNAAAIFEAMDDLDLVTRILAEMGSDDRGAIMAAMTPEFAGRLTRMMDPDA
ncbi:MAG: hypothetical protein NC254_10335 [bacterium]|nr:hypothetical protein [Clostridium sp.]MCM1538782.1 hypothetical protein [bacterium]